MSSIKKPTKIENELLVLRNTKGLMTSLKKHVIAPSVQHEAKSVSRLTSIFDHLSTFGQEYINVAGKNARARFVRLVTQTNKNVITTDLGRCWNASQRIPHIITLFAENLIDESALWYCASDVGVFSWTAKGDKHYTDLTFQGEPVSRYELLDIHLMETVMSVYDKAVTEGRKANRLDMENIIVEYCQSELLKDTHVKKASRISRDMDIARSAIRTRLDPKSKASPLTNSRSKANYDTLVRKLAKERDKEIVEKGTVQKLKSFATKLDNAAGMWELMRSVVLSEGVPKGILTVKEGQLTECAKMARQYLRYVSYNDLGSVEFETLDKEHSYIGTNGFRVKA